MQLFTIHKILIWASLATGAIFSGWAFSSYHSAGDTTMALAGSASLCATVCLGFYLRAFYRHHSLQE